MKKTSIDMTALRAALKYDPETGLLFWIGGSRLNCRIGKPAGFVGNRGYIRVKFDGAEWLGHVIAWALVHKQLPPEHLEIDHINRNPSDNRLANLRLVTRAVNASNKAVAVGKNLGGPEHEHVTYLHFNNREQKWKPGFRRHGRKVHVGTFSDRDAALFALDTALKEYA